MPSARPRLVLVAVLAACFAAPAVAQTPAEGLRTPAPAEPPRLRIPDSVLAGVRQDAAAPRTSVQAMGIAVTARSRPAALVPLDVSYAGLQALDLAATLRLASSSTLREANPLFAPFVPRPAAAVAVKAGVTGATIWLNNRASKHHPVAAVVTMVALNSFYAAVVAHNHALMAR